jgi:putative selenium metabolism protein SsnA
MENGALEVSDGKIIHMGKTEELKKDDVKFYDLKGRLVLPGLMNPHHHLYSALATGLAPIGPTENFQQILENLWWHLDQSLDKETSHYSALHGLLQSIKFGVTTVFDHHASMNAVRRSLDFLEIAFIEANLKGLLCYEVSDRTGKEAVKEHLEENIRFYEEHRGNPQIQGLLGLHANFTLSDESMRYIAKHKPAQMPIHIHCGEDKSDFDFCVKCGTAGPVDRLKKFGLLDQNSLLAHCIHLSETDYELIESLKPVIISNPESNANNNVGVMNTQRIKNYILGTDGMTGNILGTMRSHFLLRNGNIDDPLKILFQRPAELIQRFFPKAGTLKEDFDADIAVTDYVPVTPISLENLFYHLVFGVQGQEMYMTISNGTILWEKGEFKTFDEEKIRQDVREAVNKLYKVYHE